MTRCKDFGLYMGFCQVIHIQNIAHLVKMFFKRVVKYASLCAG